MGVELNLKTINEHIFRSAILDVLNNATYKVNAQKTAALTQDKPIPARELFLYWVDYVIRHKGAKHLISNVAHELTFFQYHSIDVITFLLVVIALVISLTLGVLYCLLKIVCHVLKGKDQIKTKVQ